MYVCIHQKGLFGLSLYISHTWGLPFAQTSMYILPKANHATKWLLSPSAVIQCFDNAAHYLDCKILNFTVKNKNVNPYYLRLSPHQWATPGTNPIVVNCRTTDCLPAEQSQLHSHFHITLTSKCILNTRQQGKQEANKLHLKHLPETCSRILTAL